MVGTKITDNTQVMKKGGEIYLVKTVHLGNGISILAMTQVGIPFGKLPQGHNFANNP